MKHAKPGGGFSHWHGIRICACLLGHFFAKFGIAMGWFHQRRRSPNYINWVYFGQIIVKSTQFDPNWVLFFRKWYTDGWEIWQKIGIEIVRFSRSGRHIHVRFWWKNPPPPPGAKQCFDQLTQELLGLPKFKCHFRVSQTVCFWMPTLFCKALLII